MYNLIHRIFPAAALLSAAAFIAVPAHAGVVLYSTTGTFGCGAVVAVSCSTTADSITVTGASSSETLTFLNGDPGVITPGFTNLGYIAASALNNNTGVSLAGATFSLTVNQTVPGVASGTFSDTMTGSIETQGSNASVTLTPNSITLAGVQYTLAPAVIPIPAPSSGNVATITAFVADAVPEPTLFGLTGLGFAAVFATRLRRRRGQQASV
jgi:hypothetical protein